MTINKKTHTGYEGRFGEVTSNSPTGSYKNKSDSSTNDGSFLEQDWANDAYDGLNGAFLANVHDASTGEPTGYTNPFNENGTVTLNGNVDNAQASQVYNAWYKKTQDVADGRIAAKQLEEKIAELQPQFFNYYSNLTQGTTAFTVGASNSGTILNFNKNGVDADNTDKIINANILEVDSADPTKLKILNKGIYNFQLMILCDGGQSYTGYDHEILINDTAIASINHAQTVYKTTLNSAEIITRVEGLNSDDTYFLRPSQSFQPELFLKIDNDDSYLQLKLFDGTGAAANYNVIFNIKRVAPVTATYTFPSDLMTDLT